MIDIVVMSMVKRRTEGDAQIVVSTQAMPANFQIVADSVNQLSIGKRPDSTKLNRPNKRNCAGLSEWTTASNVSCSLVILQLGRS